MRFQRTLALLGVALAWRALGPVVPVLALASLGLPRVRDWLRPTWRVTGTVGAVVLALVGVVLVVPDGWLPIPPGSGSLVTPAYVGRPALTRPLRTVSVPQHPGLAQNGAASVHGDAWRSDSYAWAGPRGESPEVDTSWLGGEQCATLLPDSHGRLVAHCSDSSRHTLRVLDAETLRPLVDKTLPEDSDGGCPVPDAYLDDQDRVVVPTADRGLLVVDTDDAEGEPDLTTAASHDLSDVVAADDCVVAVLPDWQGRIWFATTHGRVGIVDPDTGVSRVLDLGEAVTNSFAMDRSGAYLVTAEALYRLVPVGAGRPTVSWRTAYDTGGARKSGQQERGSGTTPTLLGQGPDQGLVAIADNAEPRLHVVFLRRSDGAEVCREEAFDEDESATERSLVSVGTGVVVQNTAGYDGRLSTVLGRTPPGGLARVDVVDGECATVWTSDVVAPSSVSKLSQATGLIYAYTKRSSWWGASAWYLSGLDARTGRTVFAVRTGLGLLLDGRSAPVTITEAGAVYVGTVAGLVRVRDRQ